MRDHQRELRTRHRRVRLTIGLCAAIEIANNEPFANDLDPSQRLFKRARHRDRSSRAALGCRGFAVAGLLVHGDRLRNQIDVFSPARNAGTLLPTNRAQRFIEDGEQESMFYLLASFDDLQIPEHERPLLPSLRHAADATLEDMIVRPLLANATDPEIPVIAYGRDTTTAFGLLRTSRTDNPDELHSKAIENLANQTVEIEELDLGGFRLLAITNSFFATEKLLDQPFMRQLHARLRAPLLAASVPRRGLMFVTNAAPSGDAPRAMSILAAITEKESTTSRRISKAILLVSEGAVVGHAQLGKSDTDDEPTTPPPKKPGLLKRLFGKN